MKKYKVKTLLASALIAGMAGTFCLSGCGKISAEIPVKQSEMVQEQPVKIAKLSMDGTILTPHAGSVIANQPVSKKKQASIEPRTAKHVTGDGAVAWGG